MKFNIVEDVFEEMAKSIEAFKGLITMISEKSGTKIKSRNFRKSIIGILNKMTILELIVITLVKIVIILTLMLLTVSYLVYFERRVSAWAQNRLGPNRVGWEGILQPFADVFKLLLKEDIVPTNANKTIHALAPMLALFVAFTTYAVIPVGPSINLFGLTVPLVVADINIGILYIFALTSLGVYAITFAGWSSGSKYSLLGRYSFFSPNDFL